MLCIKCKKEIPDGSAFCNHCGKKQTKAERKNRKRPKGTGTIHKDARNTQKPWIANAPAARHGKDRVYLGAFRTYREAQDAIESYIRDGRPELYNATVEEIYNLWKATHFKRVSESAVNLYTSMWKRFEPLYHVKMAEVRTEDFQQLVNACKSKSAADIIKSMAVMLCKYSMQNDVISKNYGEFVMIPKFERKEKLIFSKDQIDTLWKHADDKRAQVILFLIYTGLRIGELANLKPGDVHLDDGYIVCGEKTKAGKNRVVPLSPNIPELSDFLRKWIRDGNETVIGMSVNQIRNDLFYSILTELGMVQAEKDTKRNIRYHFTDQHHLTPHSTRHTFASLCSTAGVQPDKLQKIIGHANFSTTAEIYIHKDITELSEEMAKIKK